ncbi:N-acetylmuramoyl-L-alanine amidase family protein [Cohnella lupini]|uniref:N-acetylmuramoyl-L-alanine amidase n=1 Tax=Cohnella lupini TaxID=1294267 RepID=A0A3D9IFP7_9BACL|nr:N-acetylmuramoyl-L-alanine amidase family protein [Cohnella lupini]RED60379.1 N-acetylmuramoyl-L-alanine amidase [Cohnella lupini]
MKKWLSLLFVVSSMLFLSAGIVHAAKTEPLVPKLVLDGVPLQPQEPPTVVGQSVMIPVRIAVENMGYKVDYDNKKKQVTVSNGSKNLVMVIDQQTAYFDNVPMKMDVPPTLISNDKASYTFIPLRFLSQSYGLNVIWDNKSKSAFLYSPEEPKPGNETETPDGDGGLIGIVDPDEEDGSVPGDGTIVDPPATGTPDTSVPPVINGNLYEVYYDMDLTSVVLKYDGTIAPTVLKLDNPKRIVVDLPNAQFMSDFLPLVDFTQVKEGKMVVSDHPALTSIRYSLFGEATKAPRIVLDLNQAWDYELVNDPMIGELRIFLKKPLPDKSLFTVVLDAGHGGSDPGAISITKRPEKDYNLSVILKVQALLAGDERLKLILTRSNDSFPSLSDRYTLANSEKADLFVSVHANSYTAATNGTETYYTRADSKEFANLMHTLLVQATGLKDNGVRQKSLAVTRETTMPAILLESGYLSSKIDEPQLWAEDFQNRVAQAIATGIKMQLKIN